MNVPRQRALNAVLLRAEHDPELRALLTRPETSWGPTTVDQVAAAADAWDAAFATPDGDPALVDRETAFTAALDALKETVGGERRAMTLIARWLVNGRLPYNPDARC